MARVLLALEHRLGGHCASSAWADLLLYLGVRPWGIPLGEDMVFGLAGGLDFQFFLLPGLRPLVYLGGRRLPGEFERALAARVGLKVEKKEEADSARAWELVKALVDRGIPVPLWADVHDLEYLRARNRMSMHTVLLVGYDEEEGVAFLLDNDREGVQATSLESLARARSSTAFPGPHRNTWWEVEPREAPPPLDVAIMGALEEVARALRSPGRPAPHGVMGGLGLAGVEVFRETYPRWPELLGEARMPEACLDVYLYVEKAGTGFGGFFRSMYARFLEKAGTLLADAGLREAARLYASLGEEWSRLARELKEGASEDPMGAHARGVARVDRLASLEREGAELLASVGARLAESVPSRE